MTPARLAANISGTPSKGRIYALHGVTDNAASLSDISARWSNDYEVVLIDALGHGCSPRFTPTQLEDPFEALVSTAASLICTIEEASPAPFVTLLGHSMGGATAAEVVSRGLAPVDALVLEDPALLTPWGAKSTSSSRTIPSGVLPRPVAGLKGKPKLTATSLREELSAEAEAAKKSSPPFRCRPCS